MKGLTPLDSEKPGFTNIIGTGGIGTGVFFLLEGNHSLGRNESRPGKLAPYKDYCKLHIILHYISKLLGSVQEGNVKVIPIGKVGDDEQGVQLISMMKAAGMITDSVLVTGGVNTLFSICFQYPDSTGGNITSSESASSHMSTYDIDNFFGNYINKSSKELILAAPEVPVPVRIRLLENGRKRRSFNIASLLSSEVEEFRRSGGLLLVDLLAVNIDEARAIAGIADENTDSRSIVCRCYDLLAGINPTIILTVTDGPRGSFCCYNGDIEFTPALKTQAVATGGAGDAFLSGVLTGLCCGLPMTKGRSDSFFSETPIESAVELGTLLASLSVTSPDTIHVEVDASMLYSYACEKSVQLSPGFLKIFKLLV